MNDEWVNDCGELVIVFDANLSVFLAYIVVKRTVTDDFQERIIRLFSINNGRPVNLDKKDGKNHGRNHKTDLNFILKTSFLMPQSSRKIIW